MLYFCASPRSFVLALASGSSIAPSMFMAAGSDWIDAPSIMGCMPFSVGCAGACVWASSSLRSSGEDGGMCACRKPDGFVGRCWIWLDPEPVDSLVVSFGRGVLEAMVLVVDTSAAALYLSRRSMRDFQCRQFFKKAMIRFIAQTFPYCFGRCQLILQTSSLTTERPGKQLRESVCVRRVVSPRA